MHNVPLSTAIVKEFDFKFDENVIWLISRFQMDGVISCKKLIVWKQKNSGKGQDVDFESSEKIFKNLLTILY